MEGLHQHEKDEFVNICREHGLEESDKRIQVLETFLASPDHLTVAELQEQLDRQGVHLETHFIAETLELLCRYGYAFKKEFEGQEVCYEHRHLGWHHDHLICARCGSIAEFHDPDMEALQRRIAREHHFTLLHHKMELYGICAQCRQQRQPVMPLAFVLPGERVTVERLAGGSHVQQRLAAMGLTPGTSIEVIKSAGPGPVIVGLRGSRLALGHGISQKIMVIPEGKGSAASKERRERATTHGSPE